MRDLIIKIINNTENVYEGDLRHYFKLVFNAPNKRNAFHNFRHMMHVTCETYKIACDMKYWELTDKRRFRALLIAAMFHDYDHSNKTLGNDKDEIAKAIMGIKRYILPEDKGLLYEIEGLISVTEYPHANCDPTTGAKILRDADMSQNFDDVWLQQIIFGLSEEMEIEPLELLRRQVSFLNKIKFNTEYAEIYFLPILHNKIRTVEGLLEILKDTEQIPA